MQRPLLVILLLTLFARPAQAGGEPSSPQPIGLSVAVETDGMLGGRVTRLVVTKVAFGSQAKAAGVQEGDEIMHLHGAPIQGVEAKVLKHQMNFQPGEIKVSDWRPHLERHRNRIRIGVHQSSDGQQWKQSASGVDGTAPI